jgi:hypothetical protein
MGETSEENTLSFQLVAPFSLDSIFNNCDSNLHTRFVLILNYKHVRTAGLTVWDLTRTKQGEKKEYTPFLAESKYELSIRGLAQLVDEKSN